MSDTTSSTDSIPCDIVLLPSGPLSTFAISASQALAPQGSLFTLDNQHYYAHGSLYMFQMGLDSQDELIAKLSAIAIENRVQHLAPTDYYHQDTGRGKGYIDINLSANTAASALQRRVIEVFNPLRASMRESDKRKMADATGLKLANLQNYGYPAVGELFRPHVTLTKFPAEIEPDLSVLPSTSGIEGVFNRMGLFEMGDNGTCIRQIAVFDLQQS